MGVRRYRPARNPSRFRRIPVDAPGDFGDVPRTMADQKTLREFVYLDLLRVQSLAAQLGVQADHQQIVDRAAAERLFLALEPSLAGSSPLEIGPTFDFNTWTSDRFKDGQFIRATGTIRLIDFLWLAAAVGGLPSVLKKMSKIEIEALKGSEEGKRMSKSQIQARTHENLQAIAKVEEYKMDELSEVVQKLYGDVVRVKVRPSNEHWRAQLVGSAYSAYFYDTPAALSQKYGVEIDAPGWTVVGQLNVPNYSGAIQPSPVGNQMEDAFEQIALLMNNAFRLANAPTFPALSMTPIAIYRTLG
jgi:hypothetical protein